MKKKRRNTMHFLQCTAVLIQMKNVIKNFGEFHAEWEIICN